MPKKRSGRFTSAAARAAGVRSGLELSIKEMLEGLGRDFGFEDDSCIFNYHLPVRKGAILLKSGKIVDPPNGKVVSQHTYTCDFVITKSDGGLMFIESKGYFKPKDRTKHVALKKQYPDIDLRILFSSNGKVSSKTSYAQWAEKQGIGYYCLSTKEKKEGSFIPEEWLAE